jgi:diguanylate cyclase (GGDEF)-like protein
MVADTNPVLGGVTAKRLRAEVGATVLLASDRDDAVRLFQRHRRDIALLVTDDSADGRPGALVCLAADHQVPVIVYTEDAGAASARHNFIGRSVIDVIHKDGRDSLDYMQGIAVRVLRNRHHKAMVVDDAGSHRRLLGGLLRRYLFDVRETASGEEALEVLAAEPDISLMVVDLEMPGGMNGLKLTSQVRKRWPKDRLAIVGCSASDLYDVAPRFFKAGANDFIAKPFTDEELFCRVSQNVEIIDQIRTIRLNAVTDHLSGLFNRRHLFDAGPRMREAALRQGFHPIAAMADIDHFKRVNDTYGHDAGDVVIRAVSAAIRETFSGTGETVLVARFGGEEFCVVLVLADAAALAGLPARFEAMRKAIAALTLTYAGQTIRVTASCGVCTAPADSLEDQITLADSALYEAKDSGRNRVVFAGLGAAPAVVAAEG